ncbi:MAG: FAD-dependent oxidoreductase [Pseudomonadota bacterium]
MTGFTQSSKAQYPSIAIIGAGIIGLSSAWALARRGARVSLYDQTWPPRGASWAAAGMLAPAYEAAGEIGAHPRLFELCMQSADLWPCFAADLEAASGIDVGYHPGPTLAVATTEERFRQLESLATDLTRRGIRCGVLRRAEALTLEGALGPSIIGAITHETDGQVDNRAVIEALIIACEASGVRRVPEPPQCDITLETVGWQADGNHPVKGQLLSLTPIETGPRHVVNHGSLYIVPKRDRIVIGATSEPGRSDTAADKQATDALRQQAIALIPDLSKAKTQERWAGVRPATADRAPVFGNPDPSRFIATGHYRNGILLAPITARLMADMILDGHVSDLAAAFSPDRFVVAD